MDFWNLIPAVRQAREERDRAQAYADECRDALRRANEKLEAASRRPAVADECAPRRTDCYVAVFGPQQVRGIVTWAGPGNHGTTNNLAVAGIFDPATARKIVANSRSKVMVPVWFIDHLQVRRLVDTHDDLNNSTWHPILLEKAIRAAVNAGAV